MKKLYLAIVAGTLPCAMAVDAPIGRAGENLYQTSPEGRAAQTLVRPLSSSSGLTLIEAEIVTGRTHQIRVHLASIGYPVAGDRKYGPSPVRAARPMLHAWKLAEPSIGEIVATPPEDFRALCAAAGLAIP